MYDGQHNKNPSLGTFYIGTLTLICIFLFKCTCWAGFRGDAWLKCCCPWEYLTVGYELTFCVHHWMHLWPQGRVPGYSDWRILKVLLIKCSQLVFVKSLFNHMIQWVEWPGTRPLALTLKVFWSNLQGFNVTLTAYCRLHINFAPQRCELEMPKQYYYYYYF